MEDKKYMCDECGKEMHRWINVAVFISSSGHSFPSKWRLEAFNNLPYNYKEIYQKEVCFDCVGEKVQEYWGGEGGRNFGLLDKGRSFLIKYGFLKPKRAN